MQSKDSKEKIYNWDGLHWDMEVNFNGEERAVGLCPKSGCNCRIKKSKEKYTYGEYKYDCPKCGKKFVLNKTLDEKAVDFIDVLESSLYRDAEIVNIDGDLIRVQREEIKDDDYWADVKISKNKKGEAQLMVLAGSRKDGDKAQLFLDPTHEKLGFDQNNDYPREVFAVVTATFKNSKLEINAK